MGHRADKQAGTGSSAPQHGEEAEDVGEETAEHVKETKPLWENVEKACLALPGNICFTVLSTDLTIIYGKQSHLHSWYEARKGVEFITCLASIVM